MSDTKKEPDHKPKILAWHNVPVKRLCALSNPLRAWSELERPITRGEVRACIANNQQGLVQTPLYTSACGPAADPHQARHRHIQKIAHFVVHGSEEPISLDVGIPSMGCWPSHMVGDGNHRLAAAWIRGDKTIRADIGGSVDYAKELGLWAPNEAEAKIQDDYEKRSVKKRAPPA